MSEFEPERELQVTDPVSGAILELEIVFAQEEYCGWAYFFAPISAVDVSWRRLISTYEFFSIPLSDSVDSNPKPLICQKVDAVTAEMAAIRHREYCI